MATDDLPPGPGASSARLVVAALCVLEGIVLLGFAGFYAYEIAIGESASVARAVMSMLLILIGGIALLLLARGWRTGESWPRTPTIVWNALLLPVAWSMLQADRTAVAMSLGLLAIMSVVAALRAAPGPVAPADPEGDPD